MDNVVIQEVREKMAALATQGQRSLGEAQQTANRVKGLVHPVNKASKSQTYHLHALVKGLPDYLEQCRVLEQGSVARQREMDALVGQTLNRLFVYEVSSIRNNQYDCEQIVRKLAKNEVQVMGSPDVEGEEEGMPSVRVSSASLEKGGNDA